MIAKLIVAIILNFPPPSPAAVSAKSTPSVEQRPHAIAWLPDGQRSNFTIVQVSGISAAVTRDLAASTRTLPEWQRILSVYVQQHGLAPEIGMPAMLGTYHSGSGTLRFEPSFPLTPGTSYHAVFNPGALPGSQAGGPPVSSTYRSPLLAKRPTTVVAQIYPTSSVVPENLLKFYVQFSASMSRGYIYEHIHLQDRAGKDIELPFLEIDEELWNRDMTRLTLFIDPGRIKRGVQPLEEVGPALQAGNHYTLVIDSAWRDSSGQPLKAAFRKPFHVSGPERTPPDPLEWKVRSPKPGTRRPLVIDFPKPLDYALALRVIRVADPQAKVLLGETALATGERRWTFVPSTPWEAGLHSILVQTTIEDLAGNNIGKPFDVDLFEKVSRQFTNTTVKIPITIQ